MTFYIDHIDFKGLTQTVGAIRKSFSDGFLIEEHQHNSHQLLYATSGVMRLYTENTVWLIPKNRAVYIPAKTAHSVRMYGPVIMRSLYFKDNGEASSLRVISVSRLMRELIISFCDSPAIYPRNSRSDKISQLILCELAAAKTEPLAVPLPKDARLRRLCLALLAQPDDRKTLDEWSTSCGASTRTLSRLFERELGMSFRHWRQIIRFHHAIESLTEGEAISRVASRSGYKSPSAFSAAFNSYFGHPPSSLLSEYSSENEHDQ